MCPAVAPREITDAVVLAGGEGTRLRPLTEHRPKPMLPAANRPVLEYVFDALVAAGITTLHVVVGYRGERIQNYFGPTFRGTPVRYHHQSSQLGSGHALQQAGDGVEGPFLAVNGDQLTETEIVTDVLAAHEAGDARVTLGVVESEKAPNYGAVELDGATVTSFVERPGEDSYRLLNAGVYGFEASIFADLDRTHPVDGTLELPDVISTLVAGSPRVAGVRTEGYWLDATYPWDLLRVARRLLPDEVLDPPCEAGRCVAETAHVHPEATLEPPVVVSEACEVGPGAVVGPYTALGPNATVGANAVVAESVLDEDTRIGPNATVARAVTGQGVSLGPACVVAGGRGDVRVGDTVHEDRRLGAVLADRVTAPGDASFAPGTLVGPNATVGLGARVDGTVGAGAEVVR
jgi:glucose-1-phosphate thymidylyltransferase